MRNITFENGIWVVRNDGKFVGRYPTYQKAADQTETHIVSENGDWVVQRNGAVVGRYRTYAEAIAA